MKVNVSFTYQSRVTFFGHVINEKGILPDPKKTATIQGIPQPSSDTEWRFTGMVNQMSKFSPNIAHLSKSLWELLSSKTMWTWIVAQNDAFLEAERRDLLT